MKTYKVIVYREVQQQTTVEVETDHWDLDRIKRIAEDAAVELSDHEWKDEDDQLLYEHTTVLNPNPPKETTE